MKRLLPLLLLPLLLTSCSNPDTSGGVTLSRGGGDDANEFPHGSCEGQGKNPPGGRTGCGWIHVNEESHYIMPSAHLRSANLRGAGLTDADLRYAELEDANLEDAILIDADLSGADLRYAELQGADLSGARLRDVRSDCKRRKCGPVNKKIRLTGVKADSRTTCPNAKKWGTAGHDCPF
jgi:hypothetical protein